LLLFAAGAKAARVALETALYGYFAADATIAGIVGQKVFFANAPQSQADALPRMTFRVISRRGINNLGGASGAYSARVQIDARGSDGPEAESLEWAIRAALERLKEDSTPVAIYSCLFEENACDTDDMPAGSDSTRTHYRTDCFLQYRESLNN
jgi:hypothetical protein